jgi:hypothetical protein
VRKRSGGRDGNSLVTDKDVALEREGELAASEGGRVAIGEPLDKLAGREVLA